MVVGLYALWRLAGNLAISFIPVGWAVVITARSLLARRLRQAAGPVEAAEPASTAAVNR